jgi:uncharacterized lipoprotein YddW (UPF0748 family)
MKKMKKKLTTIFFILLTVFILPTRVFPESAAEIRALWVKFEELTSKEKIEQLISHARSTNINLIFAQVRRLGVVLYPSTVERTSSLVPENFDPLDYLISRAHQEKIEVHAWVNVFFVWAKSLKPPEDHITQNKNWLLKNQGNLIFLNPASTEVQNHLLNLSTELVTRYPLDGLHLDYIRYPHDTADGYPEFLSQNSDPTTPRSEEFWADHRRDLLTGFVSKISSEVLKINPQLKLSAAVIPDIREATYYKGQDWPRWLADGLVDFVVLMSYSPEWEIIKEQISQAATLAKNRFVVAGLGVWRQTPDKTAAYIARLRKLVNDKNFQSLKGFSLFSYDSLKIQPDSFNHLKNTVLSFFVQLPGMPWKKKRLSAESPESEKLLASNPDFFHPILKKHESF